MATTRGYLGEVLVGAAVIAEITAWELTETAERIDASAMGSPNRKFEIGPLGATGTFTAWMDDSDATGQGAVLNGTQVTLSLRPGGTGSTLPERTFTANIEQVAERATFEGVVERDYAYVAITAVDRTAQV